ncbi:MAG: glycerophosphodiester phosphodiesterase [Brevundimonas sp.]|nr:MAG: glycerophosphodiester phosphodiesterase [Brevundimonas sp.]
MARSSPLIIAHRGASGYRPEHTRAAYELAIRQGAHVIEPDLVMSADGVLVVRHENEIGGTTDVAARSDFAGRRRAGIVDGVPTDGWFTEDFTWAELATLRARERLPDLRPGNTVRDGRQPLLTLADVVEIARAGAARSGRPVAVAPELKHPSHFASRGLDMETALVAELERLALIHRPGAVMVQCFEVGPLERLSRRIPHDLMQLVAAEGGPVDRPGMTFEAMTTPAGLTAVAAYAGWIAAEATLILPRDDEGRTAGPTRWVADAHAAGLKVAAWTVRAENLFLPKEHRRGDRPGDPGDMAAYVADLTAAGVDAIFTDFPDRVL